MGTLDKDIEAIKNKPWLVSLICSVFVIYPNLAWIFCDMSYLQPQEHLQFLLFFAFRFFFFWGLMYGLVRFNFHRMAAASFLRRISWNVGWVMIGFLFYELLTHLTVNYDRFLSILFFQFIVVFLLSVSIGHIYMLYVDQRDKEQEIERLRVESLQSRCDALTNQINPHFFFNALNGISSLVRRKSEEDTLAYVTKLSDIFRYILQSEKKGLVSLEEELTFVEAFSHVMEVRFANKLAFVIEVPDESRDLRIPVLSLLPLLENVTVHNIIDSEHLMEIRLELNDRQELVVSNPIYPKLSRPDSNGLGLKNLENRFLLLKNKQIRIEASDGLFRVFLPLH